MSHCRQQGKDRIIFVTKEDHETPSSAELIADDPNDPYEDQDEDWRYLSSTLTRTVKCVVCINDGHSPRTCWGSPCFWCPQITDPNLDVFVCGSWIPGGDPHGHRENYKLLTDSGRG
ncbi:uncharacterized protein LOC132377671 isoform X3 [Hypanus sabinus]|uniref:uncharacterized protein LOC132377671 isoform X3 n=1 Tax=Hypanus sabinus TaxID=79690 RepID=UPI0028C3E27E|nr:uncharacterized protein LOC132377671 isoform X3 [Hypanus sabinus]